MRILMMVVAVVALAAFVGAGPDSPTTAPATQAAPIDFEYFVRGIPRDVLPNTPPRKGKTGSDEMIFLNEYLKDFGGQLLQFRCRLDKKYKIRDEGDIRHIFVSIQNDSVVASGFRWIINTQNGVAITVHRSELKSTLELIDRHPAALVTIRIRPRFAASLVKDSGKWKIEMFPGSEQVDLKILAK